MDIARLEIPVSGWTCLRTRTDVRSCLEYRTRRIVDGREVNSTEAQKRKSAMLLTRRIHRKDAIAMWELTRTFVDV